MPRSTYMVDVPVQFPVTMRDVPTTIVYDKNGTPGCCDTAIGSGHPASAVRHGDGGCVIRCTYNAASTAIFCYFNMIADTEL
ncbi:MAG: hypothetical protein GY710_20840 [Desulfobacteraceae bacterium]|nr:hypothetical protein [Desulfobacteraceae bacterium]